MFKLIQSEENGQVYIKMQIKTTDYCLNMGIEI